MKKLIIISALGLSLISLLISCHPSKKSAELIQSSQSNIVGGHLVSGLKTAQHIVGLYAARFGSCTGTLIDKNIVITAAHCIPSNPRSMYVIFGTSLQNASQANARPVIAALVSPLWGKSPGAKKNTGDIAVLKFQGEAPQGYIPASLLTNASMLVPSAFTLLAGYGLDNGETQTGSGILRETFTVLTNPRFSETEAVLDQTIGKGSCSGDSGGPAFLVLNGAYYIWGITSRGDATCKKTGIYTVVVPYLSWIRNSVRQLYASF